MAMGQMWHLSKDSYPPHALVQNSIMARASVDPGRGLPVDAVQMYRLSGTEDCPSHVNHIMEVRRGSPEGITSG